MSFDDIQYKYANYSNSNYLKNGKAELKFELINQRADFSFALFTGGLSNVSLSMNQKKIHSFIISNQLYYKCYLCFLCLVNVAKAGGSFKPYICFSKPKSTPLSSTCYGRNLGCGKFLPCIYVSHVLKNVSMGEKSSS